MLALDRTPPRSAIGKAVARYGAAVEGALMMVRRAQNGDHALVAAVHRAAFSGAEGRDEVPEVALVERLREDGAAVPALSLVARVGEQVVGHVLCSRGRVQDRPLLALGPLGVLPAAQGRGVGQALMHTVLGAADALDEPGVVLLGDPAYYARFGFVPAELVGIRAPDPRWGRHFQVRPLTAWDASCCATYRYPVAFDQL